MILINSTAITVSVNQSVSNGGEQVTYSLHYQQQGHPESYKTQNVSNVEEPITISSLHADLPYELLAQASNRYGSSNSTLVQVNTRQDSKK